LLLLLSLLGFSLRGSFGQSNGSPIENVSSTQTPQQVPRCNPKKKCPKTAVYCERPIGTVVITSGRTSPPDELVRDIVTQSNCFGILDRTPGGRQARRESTASRRAAGADFELVAEIVDGKTSPPAFVDRAFYGVVGVFGLANIETTAKMTLKAANTSRVVASGRGSARELGSSRRARQHAVRDSNAMKDADGITTRSVSRAYSDMVDDLDRARIQTRSLEN
jgi:hypothetical protein